MFLALGTRAQMLTIFATIHIGKKQGTACDFKWQAIHPSSEIGRSLGLKPEDKGYFVLQKDGAFTLRFDQPRQQELVENLLRRNYPAADLREIRMRFCSISRRSTVFWKRSTRTAQTRPEEASQMSRFSSFSIR